LICIDYIMVGLFIQQLRVNATLLVNTVGKQLSRSSPKDLECPDSLRNSEDFWKLNGEAEMKIDGY